MSSAEINAWANQIIGLAQNIINASGTEPPTTTPPPTTEPPPTTTPPPGDAYSGSFNKIGVPPLSASLYIPPDSVSSSSGIISGAEHGSPPDRKTLTLSLNGVVVAQNVDNYPSIFVALDGQHTSFGYILLIPGQTYLIELSGSAGSGAILEAQLPW